MEARRMNDRQKSILRLFLLDPNQHLLVREIADKISCSEKTIRTDFKEIDQWLNKQSSAKLVRKRSKGVLLEVDHEEQKRLVNALYAVNINKLPDETRMFEILQCILNKENNLTIQELAKRFFVNKNVIKRDLNQIEEFLRTFHLKMTAKQKVGILVEGNERNKRSALLSYIENSGKETEIVTNMFENHEWTTVEHYVKALDKSLPLSLSDRSLKNLVIHVLIAIKRLKQKNPLPMTEEEIKSLKNKKEFILAKKLMDTLEPIFSLKFPENEVAYIAQRILGGKYERPSGGVTKEEGLEYGSNVSSFVDELISKVSRVTNLDFQSDKQLSSGLKIHLQATFNRIDYQLFISNPMLDDIKKMYPYMFQVIYSIFPDLSESRVSQIPEDEIGYLTLHFQSSLERIQQLSGENKKALIVCSMGIGMSQLLKTKIERKFHSLEIVGCVPASRLKSYEQQQEVDFIISTVPLLTETPHIEISPLLFDHEQTKIEYFIKNLDDRTSFPCLKSFLNEELIFLHYEINEREELIKTITQKLYKRGIVKKSYIKSTLQREKTSSTFIGGGVAIPHGDPDLVITPTIAVVTLEEPIQWENEQVSVVFVLANKLSDSQKTKKLFHEFSNLTENTSLVEKLANQIKVEDFLGLL